MDEAILKHFETLLSVETTKLNDVTSKELSKKAAWLAGRGILQSSAALTAQSEIAIGTISIFAQTAFNIITRTMTAHAIAIAGSNCADVESVVRSAITTEINTLVKMLLDQPSFRWAATEGDEVLKKVKASGELEVTRISAEISLIAVANDKRASTVDTKHAHLVFNGPVGIVQTGPGSIGTAVQHIDGATREHLEKALGEVLDAIQANGSEFPFDKSEVEELVIEGQNELRKDKPNHTKLKGIVSGIGGAIAYAPKLKAAYDTVKWAAAFIGVNLPG